MRILIVDDNPIDLLVATKVLSGYFKEAEIIQTRSGIEALELLRQMEFPDLIFLDIMMPIMNGFDFLAQVQLEFTEYYEQGRICMLSSSIDPQEIKAAERDPGVLNYFEKPLSHQSLEMSLGSQSLP